VQLLEQWQRLLDIAPTQTVAGAKRYLLRAGCTVELHSIQNGPCCQAILYSCWDATNEVDSRIVNDWHGLVETLANWNDY